MNTKDQYWKDCVRQEGQIRSKYGLAVPHQYMMVLDVRNCFHEARFVRLANFWLYIKVSSGCNAEMAQVFNRQGEIIKRFNIVFVVKCEIDASLW